MKRNNYFSAMDYKGNDTWIITAEVYENIRNTIGRRKPEQGGILGSSDGKHIDHYYFDASAKRTEGSYTMNIKELNKVIHEWNDDDIRLIGVIHSHPRGVTRPSQGDMVTAKHIIETIDVGGKFFTPIVQVSPKLNGDIKIYPYTFEQNIDMKSQPIEIEETTPDKAEQQRLKKLSEKAPNRFKRVEAVFPDNLMSRKKVICVGCGGSRSFLETLARCGVGEFVLFDGDIVEDTNIATQNAYISEIGKLKTEVIKQRIHDINPLAKVVCINRYLDDSITDSEFVLLTSLDEASAEDTIICGCTDNFFAQDRCAQLSLKYGIPYLAAQIFSEGIGHEVIFTHPALLTKSCPRCMLESRYKKILANKNIPKTGSSAGAAVCVTDYLNAIKSYVTLSLLCYNEAATPYYHMLDKYANKNYLMTKCSEVLTAPAFEPLKMVELKEKDISFPFVTVAIEQTPEKDCPMCGGHGDLNRCKNEIPDTRIIKKNKTVA